MSPICGRGPRENEAGPPSHGGEGRPKHFIGNSNSRPLSEIASGRKRSLRLLASGALISDPQRRDGAKGPFTTATIRATGDESVLVSVIAFATDGERSLEYSKGDALAVSGRARLASWTGRDGTKKHGISVVAEQIAAAKPRRSATQAQRRAGTYPRPAVHTRSGPAVASRSSQ